jgi:hypothetical protein
MTAAAAGDGQRHRVDPAAQCRRTSARQCGRDGFLDAAEAAGARGNCIVLAHGVDGVISAFESARARRAVAVGPLVRDDLKTLALSGARLPWTVALNQPDDDVHMPAAMFVFPLTSKATAGCSRIAWPGREDGRRDRRRFAADEAFRRRVQRVERRRRTGAGRVPFRSRARSADQLRRTLGQTNPDAVLLAVSGDAALLKPFIGSIRAYASGLVFERPPQAVARDLLRVVEVRMLTPNAAEFNGMPRRFDSAALARHALGLDAFRVAAAFGTARPSDSARRLTGHISLALDASSFAKEACRLSQRRARPARHCALIHGCSKRTARRSAGGGVPGAPEPDDRRAASDALRRNRLIAQDGSTLVFVEVRMRSSRTFGGALESITAQKRARMIAAARGYLAMIGGEPACRFDAILMQRLDAACIDWRRDIVDVE